MKNLLFLLTVLLLTSCARSTPEIHDFFVISAVETSVNFTDDKDEHLCYYTSVVHTRVANIGQLGRTSKFFFYASTNKYNVGDTIWLTKTNPELYDNNILNTTSD